MSIITIRVFIIDTKFLTIIIDFNNNYVAKFDCFKPLICGTYLVHILGRYTFYSNTINNNSTNFEVKRVKAFIYITRINTCCRYILLKIETSIFCDITYKSYCKIKKYKMNSFFV